MSYIKLEYSDYQTILDLMKDQEELSLDEQVAMAKIEGIVKLMEKKRLVEDQQAARFNSTPAARVTPRLRSSLAPIASSVEG